MPVAPFVPLITTGIGLFAGHKKQQAANNQLAQQQAQMQPFLDAQAGLARQQTQQGAEQFRMGMPLAQGAGNYYSRLLSGDRSSLRLATLPQRQEITDTYRGAERGLSRSGLTGASRDVATANLTRDRASKLSSLVPQARTAAADASANLGTTLLSGGASSTASAGGLYNQLLQGQRGINEDALASRKYNDEQASSFGSNLSELLLNFYKAWGQRGSGGGGRTVALPTKMGAN